jgi:hypothetical protein
VFTSLTVGIFWISSCSSSSSTADGAENVTDTTVVDGDSSGDIEVDEGLLSTEVRLPLDLFTAESEGAVATPTEEELQAAVNEDGFDIDVTINSDNTVTYRMSRAEYGRFKERLKEGLDEGIQDAIDSESTVFKSVTYSDDLREFKVVVNRSEYENSLSAFGFGFGVLISATFYQAFMGVEEGDRYVVISYLDEQTNEVFDTYDSREIEE